MRLVICDSEDDGRSFIRFDGVPDLTQIESGETVSGMPKSLLEGQRIGAVFVNPPSFQPSGIGCPGIEERLAEYDLSAGQIRWTMAAFGPNVALDMHRTSTIDMNTVISGSITIEADNGSATLDAGDSALILGSRHGWRTGEAGATVSFVMAGLL